MIILMGLAGSGKSTQGKMLAENLGGVWLSAGQVLREQADPKLKETMDQGQLVDDEITIDLMCQAMARVLAEGKEVVLDGYPRTERQAQWMAENAAERISAVVWLEVPRAELVRRLQLRGRSDDLDAEAVEKRLQIVEQNIYSVCEVLKGAGVPLWQIDGTGTIEEVAERLAALVKTLNK